jgi:hypothetical protein
LLDWDPFSPLNTAVTPGGFTAARPALGELFPPSFKLQNRVRDLSRAVSIHTAPTPSKEPRSLFACPLCRFSPAVECHRQHARCVPGSFVPCHRLSAASCRTFISARHRERCQESLIRCPGRVRRVSHRAPRADKVIPWRPDRAAARTAVQPLCRQCRTSVNLQLMFRHFGARSKVKPRSSRAATGMPRSHFLDRNRLWLTTNRAGPRNCLKSSERKIFASAPFSPT